MSATALKICVNFPMRAVKHYDEWIAGHRFAEVGALIERRGFDAVSVAEHPFPPDAWLADGGHHAFDPFVALGAWGAVTERITLMTAIVVASYRSPFVTAKAVASLDHVAPGRVVLGLGAGYLQGEFEALGLDYSSRGAYLDAAVPAMRDVWAGRQTEQARFATAGHTALPRPSTPEGPPIWFGGNSAAARRRAVEIGDGWMPIAQGERMAAITRTPALTSFDDLESQVAAVAERRAARGVGPLDVAFTPFEGAQTRRGTMDDFCDALVPNLQRYAEAGVTWLTIEPTSRSFDALDADLGLLADRLDGMIQR